MLKSLMRFKRPKSEAGADLLKDTATHKEKDAAWYDAAYQQGTGTYHQHYTTIYYYPLWTVILSAIGDLKPARILEIGCGPGQLAQAIRDHFPDVEYCGFDFSATAVELARKNVPEYRFEVANALETTLYTDYPADFVISTEVLEHVEEDLQIIRSLPTGIRFIGTVPNFDYKSHVRFFQNEQEVTDRYAGYFDDFRVKTFISNNKGKKFYLLEGTTR